MVEDLTEDEITEVLHAQLLGRLGCYADGQIYIVPISYVYDGKYVYGHSYGGQKISMMRKNPAVCFEVEEIANIVNWKTVIAWGTYEEITEAGALAGAQARLASRRIPEQNGSRDLPGETATSIIFRILLTQKTGRRQLREVR